MKAQHHIKSHITARQQGFSLIELLVAMAIGLVVTLAASSVLLNFEGNKRKMTSVNDVNQAGAYISYVLDRSVRSAGSGFASRGAQAYGCSINASRSGTAILPAPLALPAPFASLDRNFRLAPLVIYAGASEAGSDVLAFMKGSHGFGESPVLIIPGSVSPTQLRTLNTLGWRNNDMALVFQQGLGCLIEQVGGAGFAGSSSQILPFSGTYYTAAGTNVALADFGGGGGDTYVAALGNVVDNRPEFQVVGVGANNTLFSYDLLRFEGAGTTPQTIADGVVELRAVYGIDENDDGVRDGWASPSAAGWTSASLLNGSATATNLLRSIVAVRIGLILRTSAPDKEVVSPTELKLFSDLGGALEQTRTLTADERLFRHRTVELTVPLRNVLTSNLY
jgi:type IV pilus assembly protein PilW